MTPLTILHAAFLGSGNSSSMELFLPIAASMFVKFKQKLLQPYRDFWHEGFMVRNTVKTGQS